MKLLKKLVVMGAAWTWAYTMGGHAFQGLSVGQATSTPGSLTRVAVSTSDASGMAAARFVLNFDPDFLTLAYVTRGDLGFAFTLESRIEEGRVTVALARADALEAGTGVLAYLDFEVNVGAPAGTVLPLTIANVSVAGQHGVDLSGAMEAVNSNGSISIISTPEADTDGDGLPDWWERLYFGDLALAEPNADADSDGMANWEEYIAGTNPMDRANALLVTGASYEGGRFRVRFPSISGRVYELLRSVDLAHWEVVCSDMVGTGHILEMVDLTPPKTNCAVLYRIRIAGFK